MKPRKFNRNLGWSISRITLLNYCNKKYFFQYYPHSLKDLDKRVWLDSLLLKWLSSFQMRVWEKTHHLIGDYLRAVAKGEATEEKVEHLKQLMKKDMERIFERAKKKDYTKYDKYNRFGFSEMFYDINIDGQLEEAIEKVWKNLDTFRSSDMHDKVLEYMQSGNTYYIEPKQTDFEQMKVNIDGIPELMNINVWAQPDFGVVGWDKYTIYDWKTGVQKEILDWEISEQLKVYALKLLANTHKTLDDVNIDCYEMYLPSQNTRGGSITQSDIDYIQQKIIDDVNLQKTFLVNGDEQENRPLPIEDFPRTLDINKCASCRFRKVCEDVKRFEKQDASSKVDDILKDMDEEIPF